MYWTTLFRITRRAILNLSENVSHMMRLFKICCSVYPDFDGLQRLDTFDKPVGSIKYPDQEPDFVVLPNAFHLR